MVSREGASTLAYQTLISFLDGALLNWPRETWGVPRRWAEIATMADAATYPRVAASGPHGAQLEWDDVFYGGLDLLLRGLEDRLARGEIVPPAGTSRTE
ncbi:MAG TPA: hypothetical protein VKX16_01815 [Chloroflexota bacterium]|nr:hypothetical protein [Chloroflexota bacterium]